MISTFSYYPTWTKRPEDIWQLYRTDVINGVPVTENMSAIFATSLDPRTASHVEVLTGGIPAEFGGPLGAVVNVNTKSGLDMPISGEITGNIGSFVTGDAAATFGG